MAAPEPLVLPPGPPPTLGSLFLIFARIGLTSFGGGLSGWLMREFVRDRRWVDEETFLNGLALSQALPGVNVTNMAIWIGYRLLGPWGAAVGVAGIVVPPAVTIVLLAQAVAALSGYPSTRLALDGAAAAAIGLSLSMGIVMARRVPRRVVPLTLMTATALAVAVLHWPLILVVLGMGGLGVAAEWWRLARLGPRRDA